MNPFALNHMTVARLSYLQLLDLAVELGCVGVEVRNDLPQPLFDGMPAAAAGDLALARGLRLLAVAEVKRLIDWSADKAAEALALMKIALAAGAEAVAVIEAVAARGRFRLVHDTFHHTLAGGGPLYPGHTGIVPVSGVVDQIVTPDQMTDGHRILVDGADRLGNIDQLEALSALGWSGPVSFEAFAPAVHAGTTPTADLGASMTFIREAPARRAA